MKNARCRMYGVLAAGEELGSSMYSISESTDPASLYYDPALPRQPAIPFSAVLRGRMVYGGGLVKPDYRHCPNNCLFSNPNNSIKTSYFLNLLLLPCSLASNLSFNRFIFLIGVVVLKPSSFEVGQSWGPEWVDSRSPPPYLWEVSYALPNWQWVFSNPPLVYRNIPHAQNRRWNHHS